MSAIAIPSFPGLLGVHLAGEIDRAVSDKMVAPSASNDPFGPARMHSLMNARANAERRKRAAGSGSSAAPIRLVRAV